MKYRKVLIISESSSFPWGMASTTRVRNIAKGLVVNGVYITYIGLRGADVDFTVDKKKKGQAEGIEYDYPGGFAVRSQNWWMRRLDDFFGKWLSVFKVLSLKLRGEIEVVVFYTRNHKVVLFWSRLLHLLKIPVVLEVCEWPLAIAETEVEKIDSARKFCHDAVLAVDAVLPISSYIDDEVKKIADSSSKSIPSFKIPILIDTEIDQKVEETEEKEDYLLYCGSILYMDIAMLIVDISCELKKRGRHIKIIFTGGGFPENFDRLKEYAREKDVLNDFEFTGFVDEQVLHNLMREATALLAPLPDDLQSKTRFSTKLGYYLASGSPVVTTGVGSVNEFLVDGDNAYIADDCSADKIADKIEFIVNNSDSALQVAKKGQELAFNKFHFRNACSGLKEFLLSLKN